MKAWIRSTPAICSAILVTSGRPDSPVNSFNLGLALLTNNQPLEGLSFINRAIELYPQYPASADFIAALKQVKGMGQLPEELESYT